MCSDLIIHLNINFKLLRYLFEINHFTNVMRSEENSVCSTRKMKRGNRIVIIIFLIMFQTCYDNVAWFHIL